MEKKNRHVVEIGFALMVRAGASFEYWVYGFRVSIYLINTLPSKVLGYKNPYELFKATLDYEWSRTFGYLCYPYTCPYTDSKLDMRYVPCIFMGYSKHQK